MSEPTAPTKRCPAPDHVGPNPLPAEAFSRHSRKRDGRQSRCRECQRRYSQENPEKTRDSKRRYRQANAEKISEQARQHYQANLERERELRRERNRERYEADRQAVFGHYGWACACCGSTEDPTIDHVAGGGAAHRRQVGWGTVFYRWLVKQGFPAGYQTLCRPCNGSKHAGTHCRLSHAERVSKL